MPEILYHYCSNEAFHSIISTKSIRLSSLSLSNDSMEGKITSSIFSRLAEQHSCDELTKSYLLSEVKKLESSFDGLGFCLSAEPDLLSQWRGYANDAHGVSIGFSKKYLEQLGLTFPNDQYDHDGLAIMEVEYDLKQQAEKIGPIFQKALKEVREGANELVEQALSLSPQKEDPNQQLDAFLRFQAIIPELIPTLFSFKNPAFREEREWRLISYRHPRIDPNCHFYAKKNAIIPCRKFTLIPLTESPIVKVVLGPKNTTPENIIKAFLEQSGFQGVEVIFSKASYR